MHNAPYGNDTNPICGWLDVNAIGGHLQGGIVFPDVLVERYGGRGEACTKGTLRSEQVPQWLKRRIGEDGLTTARSTFSIAKVCVSPGSLIRPNHSSALLALSCPTPYVKHRNTGLIKFWKGDVGCCVQNLLTLRLLVPFAVAVPLLLALLVCQLGTGLYELLAVAVPLLLSGWSGYVVHIVPLAINGRKPVPGGDVHSNRSANRCSVFHSLVCWWMIHVVDMQCDFRWWSSCGFFGTLIKHLRCSSLQRKHRHTMELELQINKLEILHCREIILKKLLIVFSILHQTHLHRKSLLCVGGVKIDLFYSLKVCIRKVFFVWVGWRLICFTL